MESMKEFNDITFIPECTRLREEKIKRFEMCNICMIENETTRKSKCLCSFEICNKCRSKIIPRCPQCKRDIYEMSEEEIKQKIYEEELKRKVEEQRKRDEEEKKRIEDERKIRIEKERKETIIKMKYSNNTDIIDKNNIEFYSIQTRNNKMINEFHKAESDNGIIKISYMTMIRIPEAIKLDSRKAIYYLDDKIDSFNISIVEINNEKIYYKISDINFYLASNQFENVFNVTNKGKLFETGKNYDIYKNIETSMTTVKNEIIRQNTSGYGENYLKIEIIILFYTENETSYVKIRDKKQYFIKVVI